MEYKNELKKNNQTKANIGTESTVVVTRVKAKWVKGISRMVTGGMLMFGGEPKL